MEGLGERATFWQYCSAPRGGSLSPALNLEGTHFPVCLPNECIEAVCASVTNLRSNRRGRGRHSLSRNTEEGAGVRACNQVSVLKERLPEKTWETALSSLQNVWQKRKKTKKGKQKPTEGSIARVEGETFPHGVWCSLTQGKPDF